MRIQTIKKGCPLCNSDIKGNDKYQYYCKKCNLLFSKRYLGEIKEEPNEELLKEEKTFFGLLRNDKKEKITHKYIASAKSNKVHSNNCFFVTKINPKNKIEFDTIDEALKNHFKKCICVKNE